MSADLLKRLAEAGTPMGLIMEVAETLAEARAAERLLEKRREKDRDRKRGIPRKSVETTESTETAESAERVSLDKEKSPRPPKEIKPIPCVSGGRPWVLPSGVSLQVWSDFLTNRRRKRLVNTASTWKSFQDDLARVSSQTGIPPPDLIEQCTGKGWGGIYDPRSDDHGKQRTNGVGRDKSDGLSSTARAAIAVFGTDARH